MTFYKSKEDEVNFRRANFTLRLFRQEKKLLEKRFVQTRRALAANRRLPSELGRSRLIHVVARAARSPRCRIDDR